MAIYLYLEKEKVFTNSFTSIPTQERSYLHIKFFNVLRSTLMFYKWTATAIYCWKKYQQQEHIQQDLPIAQIRYRKQRLHQPQGAAYPIEIFEIQNSIRQRAAEKGLFCSQTFIIFSSGISRNCTGIQILTTVIFL